MDLTTPTFVALAGVRGSLHQQGRYKRADASLAETFGAVVYRAELCYGPVGRVVASQMLARVVLRFSKYAQG